MSEVTTSKYRIVFLSEPEYVALKSSIKGVDLDHYLALTVSGIDNFSVKSGNTVFVAESFRSVLHEKAKRGEAI